jgi:Trk K+ transport system NAD-binding subunit
MRWLLVNHELNSISKQCADLLQAAGQTVIYHHHNGKSTAPEIIDKIKNEKPDRIIVIIDEKRTSGILANKICDHLLIPLYVAQATTNVYSPIPVLILTSVIDDESLNTIQNATEQLINIYPHIVQYEEF